MNKIVFPCLIMILSALAGCGGGSTSPDDGDSSNGNGDFSLITSESIGSDGGTLEAVGFSLTVPAGCFAVTNDLELYSSSGSSDFEENGTTPTYKIEGLPEEYDSPLHVRLAHGGGLSGVSVIGFGSEISGDGTGDAGVAYVLHPATDSLGHLVCDLPASGESRKKESTLPWGRAASGKGTPARYVAGATDHDTLTTSAGHFRIIYPADLQSAVTTGIGPDLENFYTQILGMGFAFNSIVWPLPVFVEKTMDFDRYRQAFMRGDDYKPRLFVSRDKLKDVTTDYTSLRIATARAVFQIALSSYDLAYYSDRYFEDTEHLWFHTAVATWGEERFAFDQTHVPLQLDWEQRYGMGETALKDVGLAPFNGMQTGATSIHLFSWLHGSGMSAVIKHLVDEYGIGILTGAYGEILTQGKHPLSALITNVNTPVHQWWLEFWKKYMVGKIFDYYPMGSWGDQYSDVRNMGAYWSIAGASDTLKNYTEKYPDLSAKTHWIALEYPEIDSLAEVLFKVTGAKEKTGQNGIVVIGYQPGNYDLLDAAYEQVSIAHIPRLMSQGTTGLIALVVNSGYDETFFTDTTDLGLEIRVVHPLPYDYAAIEVQVAGRINDPYSTYENTWSYSWPDIYRVGGYSSSFAGYSFRAEWDSSSGTDFHYSGSMRIDIDPNTFEVTGISVSDSLYSVYIDTWTRRASLNLEDAEITVITNTPTMLKCEITGAEVCANSPTIKSRDDTYTPPSYQWWHDLVDWDCDAETRLTVTLIRNGKESFREKTAGRDRAPARR